MIAQALLTKVKNVILLSHKYIDRKHDYLSNYSQRVWELESDNKLKELLFLE